KVRTRPQVSLRRCFMVRDSGRMVVRAESTRPAYPARWGFRWEVAPGVPRRAQKLPVRSFRRCQPVCHGAGEAKRPGQDLPRGAGTASSCPPPARAGQCPGVPGYGPQEGAMRKGRVLLWAGVVLLVLAATAGLGWLLVP